jgi:hypothetical protein
MKELQDLYKRYERMGRISWSRFQLGQENLAEIRGKLTVQISALNSFMGSLTLGTLGRMEPMLQRIHHFGSSDGTECDVRSTRGLAAPGNGLAIGRDSTGVYA